MRDGGLKAAATYRKHDLMRRLFTLLLLLPLLAAGCTRGPSAADLAVAKPKNLIVWRVVDDQDSFDAVMSAYHKLHPTVSITYRKIRLEEYEHELLNAFAEDRGPDIFSIHNTWIPAYRSKLLPAPASLTVPVQEIRSGVQKEIVTVAKKVSGPTIRKIQNDFVDPVAADVITPDNKIWGLPMAVDTFALFSNKDLQNAAGIAEPPATWDAVQAAVKKLTKIDASGKIIQSGIALGTALNVDRASDILALLMMQNGARMTADDGNIAFHLTPPDFPAGRAPPGQEAAIFYTDFANPGKEVYAWNAQQPSSFEAFATGKTAMMLGYSYHIPQIRGRAPKLRFQVSPAPQPVGGAPVNFANYWVEVVSKKTKNVDVAWDFIQFATSEEQVKSYLAVAKKPSARKALRESQLDDPDLGVFAEQILTAKSWYHGADAAAAESALKELITTVLAGTLQPQAAVSLAASKVNQTLE